ncbi:MAG TPA: isocitrate lyase/phosphoenolpyruvate mutase family protein [Gemmatimonadaceae bacterium]|nr:isocitrate lyase/phosphoenolpyruvate mutase family protein [Gemmatimonadaceae bacterium]
MSLASAFLALHRGTSPLVLPNAWDVISARLVEEAGFPAIATTSAGVAWSLGYADGQHIGRDEMLAAVARIARAVRVPVTADLEAAYGPRPDDAAATARGAIKAGAVGFNFEDTSGDPKNPLLGIPLQVARIRAARAAADELGVHLVINARTDVYLDEVGPPDSRFAEVVRRLTAYRDAGADCLFAPGTADRDTIASLVTSLGAPLNVLATPASPTIAELTRLRVARVSLGGGVFRTALGLTKKRLDDLRQQGRFDAMVDGAITHADAQRMMTRA